MALYTEEHLRNYIANLIKEGLIRESSAIGTAAIMARALADMIIDSIDSVGYIIAFENGYVFKVQDINSAMLLYRDPNGRRDSAIHGAERNNAAPEFFKGLSQSAYRGYRGSLLIFGSLYDIDDPYPVTGNSFLQKYIANASTRKKLLSQFGSAAAIGMFVSKFIVVMPEENAPTKYGHVSGRTADDTLGGIWEKHPGPRLMFTNNTMTVAYRDIETHLWWKLNEQFSEIFATNTTPVYSKPLDVATSLNFVVPGLKSAIAKNVTYIHELQHLLQHAIYQTPVSHTFTIPEDSDDLTSPSHPLHPYRYSDISNASSRGAAKEKRPPKQHVKIVSSLLKELGVIEGNEVKLSGVNSAAFKVSANWLAGQDLNIKQKNINSKRVYKIESVSMLSDAGPGAILTHMSDKYLSSMPSAKKDPGERENQQKRFGSPKGKKSVARKYRLFLADLISDSAVHAHQRKFDTSNQRDAEPSVVGPKDVTKPEALKSIAFDKGAKGNLEKMKGLLKNKTGALSSRFKDDIINTSFPGIKFYSKTLDIFLSAERYQNNINMDIFKEWIVRTRLLSDELIKDLQAIEDVAFQKLPQDIVLRFFTELDLHVTISKSVNMSPQYEKEKMASVAGPERRVSSGVANMGVAWYKRANGYTWEKLRSEYDAEFVAHTATFLYTLYLIGTSNKEITSNEAYTHRLTNDNHAGARKLFFALLDEDIKKTATAIQSLSPKPKHKFRTPADFNAKKGDQYRRLAIDFIEVVQGISDEDLNDVEDKAADFAERFGNYGIPNTSKENLKDIIQKYIDSRELDKSPNAWRHEDLIYNFILQMLGYIGKKLLE